jgi:N utilization substance protein B
MSRTVARESAFKIVFETAFQAETPDELYERFFELQDEKLDVTEDDQKYIKDIINGINENLTTIDEKIKSHLKDWSFERISKVDLAILRISTFEILYRDDIPVKVSVNEAVELAKQYSDEASSSFINGILAEIIKEK